MFRCNECGNLFDIPRVYETTYEKFYGVASEFLSDTYLKLDLCPNCGCEDLEEIEEE